MEIKLTHKLQLGLACLVAFGPSFAQLPAVQFTNGIEYLEGGVGKDESRAMRANNGKWPLAMEFSAHGRFGEMWIADVRVKIYDQAENVIFDQNCDGPQMFVKLSPGSYEVVAEYQGETKKQKVSIKQGASQAVVMRWVERAK